MNSETELYKNRQWLMKAYVDDDMTMQEIADICEVRWTTIRYFFKKFGIPRKEARRRTIAPIRTHFYISTILYEKLKKIAKKERVNRSEIIRRALFDYLYKGKLNGRFLSQKSRKIFN